MIEDAFELIKQYSMLLSGLCTNWHQLSSLAMSYVFYVCFMIQFLRACNLCIVVALDVSGVTDCLYIRVVPSFIYKQKPSFMEKV